jgi:hypothetical protein
MVIKKVEKRVNPREFITKALSSSTVFEEMMRERQEDSYFSKDGKELNENGKYHLKLFQQCLKSLVNLMGYQQEYPIIGYGSLMKRSDALRTMPGLKSHELVHVYGYRRIFNMWGYLNVEKYITEEMPAALITLPVEDILNFAYRERNYTLEKAVYYEHTAALAKTSRKEAVILLANDEARTTYGEPILTYLLLCMTGARELGGWDALQRFIETTWTNQGPLNDYLKTYKLEGIIQYVTRNPHTTR